MKIIKKVFKGLLASAFILFVGTIVALLIQLLAYLSPILFAIFFIIILLYAGYYFANEIMNQIEPRFYWMNFERRLLKWQDY